MANIGWSGIRPGSSLVSVYNEALLVYLWDESHLNTLVASEADFEAGYADDDAEVDKSLKKLAKDGVLVAYELFQDDAIAVEIVVGPPLTKKELATARWHKPQTARLSLPSGVFRIDSANTLPMNESDETEDPGRVTVPAGEYALSLYRMNWDELEADGLWTEGDDWTGPHEVIVLTPAAEAKPIKGAKPLLRLSRTASWLGRYKIDGTQFQGKAIAHVARDFCLVNIDRSAAVQLGLNVGSLFRLEVEGLALEAVYVGDADPMTVPYSWIYPFRGDRKEFGAAFRPTHDVESGNAVCIRRAIAAVDFPVLKKWIPATVTILPDRLSVPGAPS
jgi:hypothetical protein